MPYGEVLYDPVADLYRCEFPVKSTDDRMSACGKWCRDLVRHITRHHRITAKTYKKMLGIDMKESLMSERTKASLRKANIKHKTYENLEEGRKYQFKKGDTSIQNYERSEQTKKRLRVLRKGKKKLPVEKKKEV